MAWNAQLVGWAIVALLLFAAEAMAPGAFMLWLGIAAALVCGLVLLFPGLSMLAQVAAFVVLSFVAVSAYRRWWRGEARETQSPTLNRRAEQLVGRVVPLDRAIVNGHGRVQIADAYWDVRGEDLPAGTPVRVIATEGMSLRVVPA